MTALLDTHILVFWLLEPKRLSVVQRQRIGEATAEDPLLISTISLWEIATLCSLGRLQLDLPLRDWLERAAAPPLVRQVTISPAIAAEVLALPDSFHRDPGDRILVATARVLGATLLTSDRKIIEADLVPTL
ncbi:MAG TPA: type II toxin-antitoxin system VapC family toxin [Kofleriaceae bacterium]|nr:type II toxin-antitoxin system VapC family toxin [Kofleriaceae bacterium]